MTEAFDKWWSEHYDMANLARGAAEDAWEAATERAAKIAENYMPRPTTIRDLRSHEHIHNVAAAIRKG